jgi:hypothetical protein
MITAIYIWMSSASKICDTKVYEAVQAGRQAGNTNILKCVQRSTLVAEVRETLSEVFTSHCGNLHSEL